MSAAGRAAWVLAFEISPILLTRGIATNIPGGVLPIVALTDSAAFTTGLLSGNLSVDNFFAKYYVLPGGSLIRQTIATYPFANQAIAANATIANPNTVSMMMLCPAKPSSVLSAVEGGLATAGLAALTGNSTDQILGAGLAGAVSGIGGYAGKLAVFTALQKTLAQHNALGGTYSIATPAYIYTDCLMSDMIDVSSEGETQQRQYRWQLNFYQPQVITQAQANNVLNSQMQKLQSGLPLSGPSQLTGAAGLQSSGNPLSPLTSILPPNVTGPSPQLSVPQ